MAATDHALIIADGDVDGARLLGLASGDAKARPLIIAADGGAGRALARGVVPDIVVGDFDSLSRDHRRQLEELGVELRVARSDKDESDMELSVLLALARGASRISILGALGEGRPEHGVANLLMLADPRLDGIEMVILGGDSRLTRVGTAGGPGAGDVTGEPGDYVSLLPLDRIVEGVRTEGLRFPLQDESLVLGHTRGLSNELIGARARVTTRRGCLLLVHTMGPAGPEPGSTA